MTGSIHTPDRLVDGQYGSKVSLTGLSGELLFFVVASFVSFYTQICFTLKLIIVPLSLR